MTFPPLLVAAVAVVRDRRVLMVTARDRDVYYLPGGKIDPGETAVEAAAREAREEVALRLDPDHLEELFDVRTQAHGEPEGREAHMRMFLARTDAEPRPAGEVGAVHWVGTGDADRCPPAGREVLRQLEERGLID
ncbi:NUDIX hydrolase [Leifsonia sp. AG29]|uniref:NUDIX hydrolase n=1 Tax=Leifsonia sp. AG29 TaxID=2598860 RepID=UPI00131BF3CC|nr:NUDIX domain-containing protein [Leifsonia sp. AG29]